MGEFGLLVTEGSWVQIQCSVMQIEVKTW